MPLGSAAFKGWASSGHHETSCRRGGEGRNCESGNPGTEPEFEHRNIITCSTLKDTQGALLGHQKRRSLPEKDGDGHVQPTITSSGECA